uniref:Dehydrogenase n=2 Tax=Photinus pyralis TaxID=7054 RepID=A0A1Y1N1C3_PHOPY
MEKWEGKVAIVTGTSSGIGRAIATQLVEAGVDVVGIARREDRERELESVLAGKKGRYYHITGDVSKEEDVLKSFGWVTENLGPVHILVNNAGITRESSLYDGETSMWREVFDTNVMGLCMMTREAIKVMRANDIAGQIVHIGSLGSHIVLPIKNSNVYFGSKFAVKALAETLRQELNTIGSQIRISCISPGLVDTEIMDCNLDLKNFSQLLDPLKSEDIADMVLFVLSRPLHVQIHDIVVRPVNQSI